jgi:hypothetical protein
MFIMRLFKVRESFRSRQSGRSAIRGLGAGGKPGWPSTMSWRQSSTKKRSASAAEMDTSDREISTKKPKLHPKLQAKLVKLQTDIKRLAPDWAPFAPPYFMAGMKHQQDQILALTSEIVGDYIAEGVHNDDLVALKTHEAALQKPIPDEDPQRLELTKENREQMIQYVQNVRTSLKG